MRIGMIFPRLSNGGGCYQLIHLARELMKRNHEVVIISYYKPDEDFAREHLQGLTIWDCGVVYQERSVRDWQPVGLVRYYGQLFRMVWLLLEKIKDESFDVLNPHEWLSEYVAIGYKQLHHQVRVVWMCNDVWHIPGHEERPEKRILFRWVHAWMVAPLDRWLTRAIDVIAVLDHRIQSIVKAYYRGAKVVVVRSGIDQSVYATMISQSNARKKLGLRPNEFVILCFSIFYRHRRFEDVIWAVEAMAKRVKTDVRSIIVGSDSYDPGYAQYIKDLVAKSDVRQKITLVTDYVTTNQKLMYLAAADVFVYPNEIQTWGLIVVEAMLSGLPCIVSTGAGVHEIIINGSNGIIYPVRRWKVLAQHLEFAATHPKAMRRMAVAAKRYVKETLSWAQYAQSMERLFTK